MPILAMGEVAKIRGRKFTKTRATDGCSGCHFHERNQACPGDSTMSALEDGGSDCVGAVWKLSPEPTAPKAEPSLYKAIRERLYTKDRETLHARTQKAVEAVEALLESTQPVEAVAQPSVPVIPAQIPWGLDGLVVDPGEEAVGQWGFFWDDGDIDRFTVGPMKSKRIWFDHPNGGAWQHFAYIPNFPGAELLKLTTGYEAA